MSEDWIYDDSPDPELDALSKKLDEGHRSGKPSVERTKPWHISANCPNCGDILMLSDVLEQPSIESDAIWYDEWQCPSCRDGVYMDWSTSTSVLDVREDDEADL